MPQFSEPNEAVDWLGANLGEQGWDAARAELAEHPDLEPLLGWLDSMSESEREGYLLDPDGRESVIAWLTGGDTYAGAEDGAAEPETIAAVEADEAVEPAPPEQVWDESRQEWLTYYPERGWVHPDGSLVESDPAAEAPAEPALAELASSLVEDIVNPVIDELESEMASIAAELGMTEEELRAELDDGLAEEIQAGIVELVAEAAEAQLDQQIGATS